MQTDRFRGSLALVLILAMVSVVTVVTVGDAAAQTVDRFTDDDGNIHESNIEFIAAAGVTKGCNPPANDRYCPSGTVTRGQMAAFLTRALDLPATAEDFFTDDETSIFQGDINRLAASKITLGCNPPANDNFCPTQTVKRDQMASFLARALTKFPPGTPSIALSKTLLSNADEDTNGFVSVGDTLTYQFVATNDGNVNLIAVAVSDPLSGLSALACAPSAGSTLAPAATMTCSATYTVTSANVTAGKVDNTASVTGTPPSGSAVTDTAFVSVNVPNSPSISLTKTVLSNADEDASGSVTLDDTLTYEMVATNDGDVALSGVTITDLLAGMSALACSPVAGSSLGVAATMTCTGDYVVTQADVDAGTIENTASVTSTPPSGPAVVDTAFLSTAVLQPVLTQQLFGIYDDGSESSAAVNGTINEGAVVASDTTFGIRIGMTNTGLGATGVQPQLQYRYIGPTSTVGPGGPLWSGWVDVTGSSLRVVATDSTFLTTDDAVTTERLGGSLTFAEGRLDDIDGAITTPATVPSSGETEFLFSVRLISADETDQYDFRLVDATSGTPYDAYGELPSVNLPYTFTNGFETGVDAAVIQTGDTGDDDQWSQVLPTTPIAVQEETTVDVGTSTGGTFALMVDGQTSAAIAYNAIAADVKSALEALSTVTTVTVTGAGTTGDPWVVTFESPIGSLFVSGDGALLTGGTGTLTLTETAVGRAGTPVYDSGFAAQGLMSALFQRVDGDAATFLRTNDFNQAQDLYGRVYFRYAGEPVPAGTRIVDVVSGYDVEPTDSNSHSITVQANGQVLMKAGGVVGTGLEINVVLTPALVADTWYRFDWHATTESAVGAGDGTFDVEVYDGVTLYASGAIANAPTKTEFEDADFGPRTETVTAWIDGVVLSNTVLPAP